MKTLQQIREAVTDNFLYHNTSAMALQGIMHYKALGRTGKFNYDINQWRYVQDETGKYIEPKLFTGWVSFTRDKKYTIAPGAGRKAEVRLIFDRDKLHQRHKIVPTRGIVASGRNPDEILTGAEARFEAEDVVMGPIPLADGLIKIQITKEAFAEIKRVRELYMGYYKRANDVLSASNWLKSINGLDKILQFNKLEVKDWV